MIRAVIDTNIVFEGLTKRGGISGAIIDAWVDQLFWPCVSNAVAYEYVAVLSRKLNAERWVQIQPALQSLLSQSKFVDIHYSWRPASPDPGDDHVIDTAMNANAIIVTSNLRDFETAKNRLGVTVLSPLEFVLRLGN